MQGQFIPATLSWTGKYPEELADIYAWSPDHGKVVVFNDTGIKVSLYEVPTHLFSMDHDTTYTAEVKYDNYLGADGYGLINATKINDGTPVWYSQPRFYMVSDRWTQWAQGVPAGTEDDNSFLWIEPVTGLALRAEVKLQINFYIVNASEQAMFDKIYTQIPTGIFYPLTWTRQDGFLKEADAEEIQTELFSLLDAAYIIWIIVFVLGSLLVVIGVALVVVSSRQSEYTVIN